MVQILRPGGFPKTAGKIKECVDTALFLNGPRCAQIKKSGSDLISDARAKLRGEKTASPYDFHLPPFFVSYMENGLSEEIKGELTRLAATPSPSPSPALSPSPSLSPAPSISPSPSLSPSPSPSPLGGTLEEPTLKGFTESKALAAYLLVAGHLNKGDTEGALEAFKENFSLRETKTQKILRALAAEALIVGLLEKDLFHESRELLGRMDTDSWGPKARRSVPSKLFRVVNPKNFPGAEKISKDKGKASDGAPGGSVNNNNNNNNNNGRGEGREESRGDFHNSSICQDSHASPRTPYPDKDKAPHITLVPSPKEEGNPDDDTMEKEPSFYRTMSKISQTADPLEAFVKSASNVIFAHGVNGLVSEAKELYDSLIGESFVQRDPEAPERLKKAYAFALAFAGKREEALSIVDSPISQGSENLRIRAAVMITLIKRYRSPKELALAEELLEELWDMDDQKLGSPGHKARAAGVMVKRYIGHNLYIKARALYERMNLLGSDHETIIERFWSSIDIILNYALRGELKLALEIYGCLGNLDSFPEFYPQIIKAGTYLSKKLAEEGSLDKAHGIYDLQNSLKTLPFPELSLFYDDPMGLIRSELDLVGVHEGDLFIAESIKETDESLFIKRAEAAKAIMEAYDERYDAEGVLRVFESLDIPPLTKKLAMARLSHTLCLFKTYLKVGDLDRATELYERAKEEPQGYDDIQLGLGFMASQLMLSQRGDDGVDKALGIYHREKFPGDGPCAREIRAFMHGLMINILSGAGEIKKADAIFNSEKYNIDTESFQDIRSDSALRLAEAHASRGNLKKAREYYDAGAFSVRALADLPRKLVFMNTLLSYVCSKGDLDYARKIFDDFPSKLPPALKELAYHRVAASFILNAAYMNRDDSEGMEYMLSRFQSFDKNELKILKKLGKSPIFDGLTKKTHKSKKSGPPSDRKRP